MVSSRPGADGIFGSLISLRNSTKCPFRSDHCINKNRRCNTADPAVESLILVLYVDDGLIASNSAPLTKQVISYLKNRFEIKIGDAACYVGLQIGKRSGEIRIHQKNYIKRKAKLLGLDQPTAVSTPLNVSVKYCKDGVIGGVKENDRPALPPTDWGVVIHRKWNASGCGLRHVFAL